MRVLSVNVGLPRVVTWHGKPVTTGIFKEPVAGRVTVRTLNLDGDRQADLRVHGGREKAVYASARTRVGRHDHDRQRGGKGNVRRRHTPARHRGSPGNRELP
jgi:MOSC domain-containing protein YiiM